MVDVTHASLWPASVHGAKGRAEDGAHSLNLGEHWDDAEAGSVILRIGPRISVWHTGICLSANFCVGVANVTCFYGTSNVLCY